MKEAQAPREAQAGEPECLPWGQGSQARGHQPSGHEISIFQDNGFNLRPRQERRVAPQPSVCSGHCPESSCMLTNPMLFKLCEVGALLLPHATMRKQARKLVPGPVSSRAGTWTFSDSPMLPPASGKDQKLAVWSEVHKISRRGVYGMF